MRKCIRLHVVAAKLTATQWLKLFSEVEVIFNIKISYL
jgi:hypothetical protein